VEIRRNRKLLKCVWWNCVYSPSLRMLSTDTGRNARLLELFEFSVISWWLGTFPSVNLSLRLNKQKIRMAVGMKTLELHLHYNMDVSVKS